MNWFKRLFQGSPTSLGFEELPETYPIETYKCCDKHTLKRQRIKDIEYPISGQMGRYDWGQYNSGVRNLVQYKYWCSCGTLLTEGPTGGCAVCAVCKKCRINYGADLPGYWGD